MEKLNARTVGQSPSCAAVSLPAGAGAAKHGKMHIIIDLAKCVGCFNCMVACKDEHVGNSWMPYTRPQQKHEQKWINPERCERGVPPFTDVCFVTKLCQHCENAPCEKAFPDAVKRRPDGIVLLDPEKAEGNRALTDACPYGMISWNEELNTAQKCTMCAHLIDEGWKEPRCVQACPLRALSVVFADDEEFEKTVKEQDLKPLTNGENSPRVLYRNLYKSASCFIAGALAFEAEDGQRAASGAAVELRRNGELIGSAETDFFGEFKIDMVPKNSGSLELTYLMSGFKPVKKAVTLGVESLCLDAELLEKL